MGQDIAFRVRGSGCRPVPLAPLPPEPAAVGEGVFLEGIVQVSALVVIFE